MGDRTRRLLRGGVTLAAVALLGGPWSKCAPAIDVSNVLVLYNSDSTAGLEIAQHYQQVHPGVRLVGLENIPTSETISADLYLSTIRPQVLDAVDSSVDVIVTTKGLPLRIDLAPHTNPDTYIDPGGVERPIYSSTWKRYSSLESELTRVDSFSTWEQLGDQTWWLPPREDGQLHPTVNPYFDTSDHFSHEEYGIRLTARLDGFSVEDVVASIDRAQRAMVGPEQMPSGPFHFVVDDRPNTLADSLPDLAQQVLGERGLPVTFDQTAAFTSTAPGPVLGYISHGRNQSATPLNYILEGLDVELADGAVFHTWESFNAYTFDENRPVPAGQGSIAQWLRLGGTVGVGHVEEPLAGSSNVTAGDIMFEMLLEGYTWAEAAWSATRQLSFVNTVVGDPLMTFRPLVPGDADTNGVVGAADLVTLLSANWNARGPAGGAMWGMGDFDGDGFVGPADLALLTDNYGNIAGWRPGDSPTGAPLLVAELDGGVPLTAAQIPEPSTLVLAILGLLGCAVALRRRPDRFAVVRCGLAPSAKSAGNRQD